MLRAAVPAVPVNQSKNMLVGAEVINHRCDSATCPLGGTSTTVTSKSESNCIWTPAGVSLFSFERVERHLDMIGRPPHKGPPAGLSSARLNRPWTEQRERPGSAKRQFETPVFMTEYTEAMRERIIRSFLQGIWKNEEKPSSAHVNYCISLLISKCPVSDH